MLLVASWDKIQKQILSGILVKDRKRQMKECNYSGKSLVESRKILEVAAQEDLLQHLYKVEKEAKHALDEHAKSEHRALIANRKGEKNNSVERVYTTRPLHVQGEDIPSPSAPPPPHIQAPLVVVKSGVLEMEDGEDRLSR